MSGTYLAISAWREVLARSLDGFEAQDNISPEWLINPATKRKLKLDRYYPDVGLAIRFVGLTAKGQKRQSDWEALETEQRDQTRVELCKINGVQLAIIDPNEDPVKQLDRFSRVIHAVYEIAASSPRPKKRVTQLKKAKSFLSDLRGRLSKNPEQVISSLAESWRDRETSMAATLQASGAKTLSNSNGSAKKIKALKNLSVNQRVQHNHFGEGVITAISGKEAESTISILFDGAEQKTFLASLVLDKLGILKEQ